MNNFLATLRMEFRGRFNLGHSPSKKAWGLFALNMIFSAIIYAVFLLAMYFVSKMILLGSINMDYEFLVVATLLSMLVQLVTSTSSLTRVLYYDVDNELLIRFPIDGLDLFLAKSVFVFLNNLIISVLFTLPFYVYYGVFLKLGAAFYVQSVVASIFISLIPFFLANLVAVPVMNINNKLKNKFALKLIFAILLIAVAYTLYMMLLRGILEYYQTQNSTVLFSEEVLLRVKSIASAFVPANFFANILYGRKVWLSILFATLITVGIGAISLYLASHSYYPTILKSIERGKETFTKKNQKNRARTVFGTIFHTELLIIFRSFNYSFQYLAMAVCAPLMVYFCNLLAVNIGGTAVGSAILPGLTLLVIIIFDTIIVSFASTTLSRSGDNFYFTKIIPVNYYVQIFTKMALYFVVAAASTLCSCLVVWLAFGGAAYGKAFTATDTFSIFGISCLIIIALSSLGIITDICSPTFSVNGEGELVEANKNMSITILVGVVLSVVFGLFAMVFTFLPIGVLPAGIKSVYLVLGMIGLGLSMMFVGGLVLTIKLRYHKIAP